MDQVLGGIPLVQRHTISSVAKRLGVNYHKLKMEMAYHQRFATKAQARAAVFEYIEVFYNRVR